MGVREHCDAAFDAPVDAVRSVSPARAAMLGKMGVRTVRDLLACYPRRYIDLSHVVTVAAAPIGQTVTVVGTVYEVMQRQPRPRLSIVEVSLVDDTGVLMGVWFRQPWMAKRFSQGARVAFSGKVGFDYGFKRMNAPFVEFLGEASDRGVAAPIVAVHPTTEGLSTTWMRRFVANALELVSDVSDPLPARLRRARRLMSRKCALRAIHFPQDAGQLEAARRRLAYEEVLYLQLEMMKRRADEMAAGAATRHVSGPASAALRAALPFTLTDGQEAAVADITADMCSGSCMNRMLLGDVGCGKTVVAAFAVALTADTGTQCALMVPTEVLARQHAAKLGGLFDACGITWGVLTGSTSAAERARLLEETASGALCCLIGTHALIEPDVRFSSLSLVVIDEQHRFGVNQRSALCAKGPGADLLVMTATPIPRTLALTLYGDLETSCIRTRPAGRPPVTTRVISRNERGCAYEAIRRAVEEGRQAYIICPLVGLTREQRAKRAEDGRMQASLAGGADISDARAAEQEAAFLADKVFPGYTVGLLTGHMGATDKQAAMDAFAQGATDVLVATTVVEVGVDVPNATVMMVEDAERFGLSQLHQLRGRVGRGQHAGQVFLVADPGRDDTDVKARMDALVNCDDGFELAEADLRARREGDVLGSRQHGAATLKLVNVVDDAELVATAHDDARHILADDPALARDCHARLGAEVQRAFSGYDESTQKGA